MVMKNIFNINKNFTVDKLIGSKFDFKIQDNNYHFKKGCSVYVIKKITI